MKVKIISLVILCLLSINSFGQRKSLTPPSGPPTKVEDSIMSENYKCIYQKISLKKRLSFYPFNKAKKVLIISYNDTSIMTNKTPVINHRLDTANIKETITLDINQVDSLTSVLYNITSKPNDFYLEVVNLGARCYNPRNSILFLNEKNKVINFIEICFECSRAKFSSKRIKPFELCETKYDTLKAFFISLGMKYGTILIE